MATWTIQARTPGAGGAWTTIPNHTDLWFRNEINALPQIQFTIVNPSAGSISLMSVGNEVRVLDPGSVEKVRGMIRNSTNDNILKTQKVVAAGKAVRLQDRVWQGRRQFPSVPPNVILREFLGSTEGEPLNGQVLRTDMETLANNGQMDDLSPLNNNGTINNTSIVTGWYGNARSFAATTDTINWGNSSTLNLGTQFSFSFRVFFPSNFPNSSSINIFSKASGNTGWAMFLTCNTGGSSASVVFNVSVGTGLITGSWTFATTLAINTWYHCVVTIDNTAGGNNHGNLYVNNVLTGGQSVGGLTLANNTTNVTTGNVSGGAFTTQMPTYIDEGYIYARVLSSTEVGILYGINILEGGLGTVTATLPTMPPRIEGDRRLQMLDGYSRALGAEWYVNQNGSDQDQLNVVDRIGSATSTQTFQLSKNCSVGSRQLDNDTIFNDLTALGVGDGSLQLRSRNFSATTIRNNLASDLNATATTIGLVSASGFPTSGIVYIGMERIQYTGVSTNNLTGCTRAYQGDGVPSYPAYYHNAGMEVYLNADTTAAPNTYYTSYAPQSGSQIFTNGLRNGVYTDKTVTDQNTLDFLALNLVLRYQTARESLILNVPSDTLTCVLGDAITVNDSSGNPYANTPYRIIAQEFSWDGRNWQLELLPNSTPHASGGYLDSPSRRNQSNAESVSDMESYGIVGDISFSGFNTANITVTTSTETTTIPLILNGVKAGTQLVFFGAITITTGTATTDLIIRLRRGLTTAGVKVGNDQGSHIGTAGQNYTVNGQWVDIAQTDNPQYSISIFQVSATGNGTVFSTALWVENTD